MVKNVLLDSWAPLKTAVEWVDSVHFGKTYGGLCYKLKSISVHRHFYKVSVTSLCYITKSCLNGFINQSKSWFKCILKSILHTYQTISFRIGIHFEVRQFLSATLKMICSVTRSFLPFIEYSNPWLAIIFQPVEVISYIVFWHW